MRRLDRICHQLRVQRYVPYWNMWSTLNVVCIVHSNMWSTTSSDRYAPFSWSCDRPTKLTNYALFIWIYHRCMCAAYSNTYAIDYVIDGYALFIRRCGRLRHQRICAVYMNMWSTTLSTDMHCSLECVIDYDIDESALFTRRRYWPLRFDALWDVSGTLVGGTLVGRT